MRIRLKNLAQPVLERALPERYRSPLLGLADRLDAIATGRDDSALSQRTALFAFAIRIFSAALAYLSQVLMARWMGSFEYGVFIAVWIAIVILGGLSCLGFQTGIIRFVSEYRTTGDDERLRGVIRGSLIGAVLAATAIAGLGATGLFLLGDVVTGYYVMPLYLAMVCLPMLALQEVQDGVARAYDWPGTALAPTFVLRPLLLLGAMAVAVAAGMAANAQTAMLSAIAATWVASLLQFAILGFRLRRVLAKGPRTYMARQWFVVALPIFVVEGFYNLLTNVDILFVGYFLEPEKVAVYFAAVKTLALVHFVYFAVKAGAAHRFTAYLKAGETDRYERFVRETVHWTFWPSLLMAAIMLVLGKYFLMLFGPGFVEGATLIWILAFGVVVRSTVGAAESVLTMSGEQRICAVVYGATLAVNICLNLLLIPRFGLEGAAMATSLALAFEAAALYSAAKRRLGLHIFILPMRSAAAGQGGGAG